MKRSPICLVVVTSLLAAAQAFSAIPIDNAVRIRYSADEDVPKWIDDLPWTTAVSIEAFEGATVDERLRKAQDEVVAAGGGAVYFPAGTYQFQDDIVLENGVILRGAPAALTDSKDDAFDPQTKFEFPRYVPSMEGDGTPIETAFKKIQVKDPTTASNVGIVDIAINRGHIYFADGAENKTGGNRIVFGCKLTNTAAADQTIPNEKYRQAPHQRFTARHRAAIHAYSGENLFIANNRIPRSGDDNFVVKPYSLVRVKGKSQDFRIDREPQDRKFEFITLDEGVEFDYDNRPGIYANEFCIGAVGNQRPNGTPETHPFGFRKGTVIRDNYIYCSGRSAIAFSGDGVYCAFNTIRYPQGLVRPTTTGLVTSDGSATNDNRAMTMRGYRWHAHANDYDVHSNKAFDGSKINDGEGIMHENHCNSAIVDSKMTDNVGNRYLCLWVVPIDGLHIEGNRISADRAAINVHCGNSDVKNVRILDNELSRGSIRVGAKVGEEIEVVGNRYTGEGTGVIMVDSLDWAGKNENFEVRLPEPKKPKKPKEKS